VTRAPAPESYALTKCLSASRATEVHLARREDGREVVLKAYLRGAGGEAPEARARRELDALRAASGAGVPAALDLLREQGPPLLVLERAPGTTLGEWVAQHGPLDVESFLAVALQLSDVLSRVHGARLIHGSVHPASVLVEGRPARAHLVAFGGARPLGISGELEGEMHPSDHLYRLSYSAPEHSGRMGRGVDFRSDLYALGATLYFGLTGRAPFESDDALALIHAHMARAPVAPIELRAQIPGAVSRIVLKLLHKEPEGRYQTPRALERDLLECRQQLERTGHIEDDFPLGTADAPHRPLFSKQLYGRDAEIAALTRSYDRAAAGTTSLLLLSGPPGVGKSGLIRALRGSLARTGGYLAIGKFDQYRRDIPYAGFAQALESLTQQILTESEERLAGWRAQLHGTLGALAGVLAQMVPDFGIVLGEVTPVPSLGPSETRERLSLALQRLIQVLATPAHPFVLCLDDLQWADAGSRDLLRDLLTRDRGRALLVLGCYRDTEVNADHPFAAWIDAVRQRGAEVESLQLRPLSDADCARMLADALGRSPEDTSALAACVSRKTGNTPLLIQQFVDHMYHLGLIHYEPRVGWTWDDAALAAADIPDDAVELLTARIARLDPAVTKVLELASCVGDRFQPETVAELCDSDAPSLAAALFALCEEGLIAPVRTGFRFVHDRIREAAQALLSPEDAARLHYQGARLLLERLSPAELQERAFEIADHLDLGAACLADAERPRAIGLHLMAGKRALQAGVAASARRYAAAAHALFRAEHWESHAALGFDLWMLRADVAYQLRDFGGALAILGELDARPLERLQAAQVAAKILTTRQIMPGGRDLSVTLDLLRRFGVDWPARPSWLRTRWAILRTDLALGWGRRTSALRPLGAGDHGRWLAPVLLITPAGGSMTAETVRLVCLATCFVLDNFRRHGYLASPGLALAGYAASRLAFRRDLRHAEVYARAAASWTERVPHPVQSLRARYVLHAFVHGWIRPRRGLVEELRRVAESARELGDLEYAYYALLQRANYLALSGAELSLVESALEAVQHSAISLATHRAAVALLRSGPADPGELRAALDALSSPIAAGRVALLSPWVFWLEVICVLGNWPRAAALAEEVGESAFEVGSTLSQLADYIFLRGLIAVECERGRSARRGLTRCLRQLRVWARSGPDFVHLAQGLDAERARMRGRTARAHDLYQAAARRAEEQGHGHHAALLHERRALLFEEQRRDTEAAAALGAAIALYDAWGAQTKVAQLDCRRRQLSWEA
jgi:hypothetical protein